MLAAPSCSLCLICFKHSKAPPGEVCGPATQPRRGKFVILFLCAAPAFRQGSELPAGVCNVGPCSPFPLKGNDALLMAGKAVPFPGLRCSGGCAGQLVRLSASPWAGFCRSAAWAAALALAALCAAFWAALRASLAVSAAVCVPAASAAAVAACAFLAALAASSAAVAAACFAACRPAWSAALAPAVAACLASSARLAAPVAHSVRVFAVASAAAVSVVLAPFGSLFLLLLYSFFCTCSSVFLFFLGLCGLSPAAVPL